MEKKTGKEALWPKLCGFQQVSADLCEWGDGGRVVGDRKALVGFKECMRLSDTHVAVIWVRQ